MKFFLTIVVTVISVDVLISQKLTEHFSTRNGLPHDITYGIHQDKQGYIWIGSDVGLIRFDGDQFELFSLTENQGSSFVIDIVEKDHTDLIIATWGGGMKVFDTQKYKSKPIQNNGQLIAEVHTFDNYIVGQGYTSLEVFDMGSDTFFCYDMNSENDSQGLFSLNLSRKNITYERSKKFSVNSINDTLYFYYEPKQTVLTNLSIKGVHYTTTLGDSTVWLKPKFEFLKDHEISCIVKENDSWIAGTKNGLIFFDERGIIGKSNLDLKGDYVTKIIRDKDDKMYIITTLGGGVKNAYVIEEGEAISLSKLFPYFSSVSDIMIDTEGGLWLTTFGEGVFYSAEHNSVVQNFYPDILKYQNVLKIKSLGKDSIYVITNTDLMLFDSLYNLRSTLKLNIECFDIFRNGMSVELFCVGEEGKIGDYNILGKYYTRQKFEKYILEASGKDLIVNGVKSNIEFEDLMSSKTYCQTKNPDEFFMATKYLIIKIDVREDKIIEVTPYDYDKFSAITKMVVIDDILYVCTKKSLLVYAENQLRDLQLMPNENIFVSDVLRDQDGRKWVATQKGVFCVDGALVTRFNKNTGLISDFSKTLYLDNDGRLLVGGNGGVSIIETKKLYSQQIPELSIVQRNCEFDISILTYSYSKSVEVQYSLDKGYSWQKSEGNQISFCDLQYGVSSIIFRYRKSDNKWTLSKLYNFKSETKWYQTNWGIALITFMSFGLLLGITLIQLSRVKARNKILSNLISEKEKLELALKESRNTIAMDFHDEMGNKMARISMMSELLLSKDKSSMDRQYDYLSQIRDDSIHLYKNTKDFIWSLKSESNKLSEIYNNLLNFGEDLFESFNIDFDTIYEIEYDYDFTPLETRNIVLICKEAMTNAAVHSKASIVILEVSLTQEKCIFSIRDNGIGISSDALDSKRGLSHIKQRADKSNIDLEILTLKGGTEVRLKFLCNIQKGYLKDD